MIYTHSHLDHFGGVKGIISQEDVDAGRVPVIAPEGFMAYAVAENVFAGTAMARRAGYMYGAALAKGPDGQIGTGLGQTTPTGETTLIPPTVEITTTGQELTIDGVRIVFQVTPGTEAPAEMNFYFPDHHALCAAENASHTLHNILTIRGAMVRDAHAWAHYLTETIDLWGDELDVVFASHHWPTWDRERAVEFLAMQRDMYLYLHDQTLRLINQGYVGAEIAEQLQMPPALESGLAHTRLLRIGQSQRQGHLPALPRLVRRQPRPPVAAPAGRGCAPLRDRTWAAPTPPSSRRNGPTTRATTGGSPNCSTTSCSPTRPTRQARVLQADAFERLGFGSENGTWRNAFLAGATELRHGQFGTPATAASADLIGALTVPQVFDTLAVRIDGPRAWNEHLVLSWVITDVGATYVTELRNGTLNHRTVDAPAPATTTFTLTRPALIGLVDHHPGLGSRRRRSDRDRRRRPSRPATPRRPTRPRGP